MHETVRLCSVACEIAMRRFISKQRASPLLCATTFHVTAARARSRVRATRRHACDDARAFRGPRASGRAGGGVRGGRAQRRSQSPQAHLRSSSSTVAHSLVRARKRRRRRRNAMVGVPVGDLVDASAKFAYAWVIFGYVVPALSTVGVGEVASSADVAGEQARR